MSGERSAGLGYLAAIVAIVLASLYPAVTRCRCHRNPRSRRPSDATVRSKRDIVRAVSGLESFGHTERHLASWRTVVVLSWLGMAACVIFGLQFAPASHSAALGPGAISAWVAVMNFLIYGVTVDFRKLSAIAAIVTGVVLLLMGSFSGLSTANARPAMFYSWQAPLWRRSIWSMCNIASLIPSWALLWCPPIRRSYCYLGICFSRILLLLAHPPQRLRGRWYSRVC